MVVKLFWIAAAKNVDELWKGHAVVQTHLFHRTWDVINLQKFVVVRRDESVKGIANKTEAEVSCSKSSCLLRRDQTCLPVGVVFPEPVRRCLDVAIRVLLQKSTEACLD